jgi:hypothetical protein
MGCLQDSGATMSASGNIGFAYIELCVRRTGQQRCRTTLFPLSHKYEAWQSIDNLSTLPNDFRITTAFMSPTGPLTFTGPNSDPNRPRQWVSDSLQVVASAPASIAVGIATPSIIATQLSERLQITSIEVTDHLGNKTTHQSAIAIHLDLRP